MTTLGRRTESIFRVLTRVSGSNRKQGMCISKQGLVYKYADPN